MILHPGILALVTSSVLIALMMIYAAAHGVLILRRWDLSSGSELQLALERRTFLVSTVTGYALAFELASLFFFIHTADSICHLFAGAMCAVGTLTANPLGYPTLLLKVIACIMAGLWLILNRADNLGYDYPLIRVKYRLLLAMVPFIVAESGAQALYFSRLRPDVITSCCGTLFSQGTRGVASEVAALPAGLMEVIFYLCLAATLATAALQFWSGRGAYLFAGLSAASFMVSLLSMVSFISLYFYEMPSHHCPFCILQSEYGYIGYPLYLALFTGTVAGIGVGVLQRFRTISSLAGVIPQMQRRLTVIAAGAFTVFAAIVSFRMLTSSFTPGL